MIATTYGRLGDTDVSFSSDTTREARSVGYLSTEGQIVKDIYWSFPNAGDSPGITIQQWWDSCGLEGFLPSMHQSSLSVGSMRVCVRCLTTPSKNLEILRCALAYVELGEHTS